MKTYDDRYEPIRNLYKPHRKPIENLWKPLEALGHSLRKVILIDLSLSKCHFSVQGTHQVHRKKQEIIPKNSKNKQNQAETNKITQAANKKNTPRKTNKNAAKTPQY